MEDPRYLAIYTLVAAIPKGKVCSYGLIAKACEGVSARMVGRALRITPKGTKLPWQRVVNASLKVSDHGGAAQQIKLLRKEGVEISDAGKINLQCLWIPG